MTRQDIEQISQNDVAFRVNVLAALARVEERLSADHEDVSELKTCVFGTQPDRSNGLIGMVSALKHETSRTNKFLAVLNAILALGVGWLAKNR